MFVDQLDRSGRKYTQLEERTNKYGQKTLEEFANENEVSCSKIL